MATEKWADYLISAVKYNDPKTHIISVKAYQDLGDKLGIEEHLSRQQVIQGIKNGKTFMTIFANPLGSNHYQKGQKVEIIIVNGTEYIKTLNDGIARDNLDRLPEF